MTTADACAATVELPLYGTSTHTVTCDRTAGHSEQHHGQIDLYDDEIDASAETCYASGRLDIDWED